MPRDELTDWLVEAPLDMPRDELTDWLVEAPLDMPRDELTDWLDDQIGRDRDEHLVIVFPFGRQDSPKIVARHRGPASVKVGMIV
jgi:hypothetical protein